MKNLLSPLLLLFFSFAQSQDGTFLRCHQSLRDFIIAESQNALLDYEAMTQIFSDEIISYSKLRKSICNDIKTCRRCIRKKSNNFVECHELLKQLYLFDSYVKQHKECCKAIHFHSKLRQQYQLAFDNSNIVECIEMKPYLYGVEKSKYKSRDYFKKISADLDKIEDFEDTIHGDHGLLKAHNYVYKIELIRIRNHVYHDNRYKYETRYF